MVKGMALTVALGRENLYLPIAELALCHLEQLHGSVVQPGGVFHPLGTALEAPPVVDRPAAGGAVPCSGKHGADDLGEEHVPPPLRQAQRLQNAVGQAAAEAVIAVGAFRLPEVLTVEDFDVFPVREILRVCRIAQTGPAQHHPAVGPDGTHALSKGIDGRRHTVHRVCSHIAHLVAVGDDARQHSQQIGHLIGAGVVGAHQRMGRTEGTVQKAGLGVLGRDLQAGGVHPGAGGEDDVRVVVGYLFQHLLCVHLGVDILPAADIELIRESFHQRGTALVLSAHPCAGLGVVLVEEHHPQLAGAGAENIQLAQQRFRTALRLQQQFHSVGLCQNFHLVPEAGQILPHLGRGRLAGVGVTVHRQVHQKRVARRQAQ